MFEKFRSRVLAPSQETWVNKTLTSAQVNLLFTTPIAVLPAPLAGYANLLDSVLIHKPAGTAYTLGAAGVIQFSYTNAAGLALAQVTQVGFTDQATAQTRLALSYKAASGASSITPVAAAAIVVHVLTANLADGTSPLRMRVFYRTVPVAL